MPLINSKCYDGNILKYYSTKSYLCAYYRAYLDGKIILGKRMVQVLEKTILETMSDKWIYDTNIEFKRKLKFQMKLLKHTKSPFYGDKFIPFDFFACWCEILYAFRMADNPKKRRFTRTLFMIARKNTKTYSASALVLSEFATEKGADILCFSNSYKQARLVYEQSDACRRQFDSNDEFTRKRIDGIYNIVNSNKIEMVSGRTVDADGYNADIVVCDEIEAMDERGKAVYNSLMQSQSIKDNPLLIMIGTEGFGEPNDFLHTEMQVCFDILDAKMVGEYADSYLPFMFLQDDVNECWDMEHTELWQKSNPTLGYVKKESFLRGLCERAKTDSSVRSTFLTKDMNFYSPNGIVWLGDYLDNVKSTSYITREELERGVASGKYKFFTSGTDLSATYDFSSTCFLLPYVEDGSLKIDIYHRIYTSPQNIREQPKFMNEGLDILQAIKDEHIVVSDNGLNAIDVRRLALDIYSLNSMGLVPIGNYYDNRFCSDFINTCYDYNIETKMLLQNSKTLTPYINSLEKYIIQNEIQVNPVVRWMFHNVRCKSNSYGDIILNKKNNYAKIDGVDSLINAFACYVDNLAQIKRYLGVD